MRGRRGLNDAIRGGDCGPGGGGRVVFGGGGPVGEGPVKVVSQMGPAGRAYGASRPADMLVGFNEW